MNVELLRKAAAMPVIMRDWFTQDEKCGMVGCIAGNICILSGDSELVCDSRVSERARKFAELPNALLFNADSWPYRFFSEYEDTVNYDDEANQDEVSPADLISRVVEDYIATDGWTK